MNIAYLIWIENLNYSIIQGQVIEVLKEVHNILHRKLYLIAFQPFYLLLLKSKELNKLKLGLKNNGINLIIVPVFYPKKWFFAKWYQMPLIFIHAFPVLLWLSLVKNIRIFHCRSYPVTFPAIMVKKLRNIKVIFDPRSDFPEENITAGRWGISSLNFKIWKNLEKIFLKDSDRTIAIAHTYISHFEKIYKNAKFSLIPNNVDTEKFRHNEQFRQYLRLQHNIEENEILFCYCGTLGGHWNNPETYAAYLKKFRGLNMFHRFLFITPDIVSLKEIFNRSDIKPEEYIAVNSKFEEVPNYLSAADIGLVLMNKPDIRMSIKTVEYLSVGVPVITNSNVGGAKEIVEENGIGIIHDFDSNLSELREFLQSFIQNRKEFSKRCRLVAEKTFSTKVISEQYAKIYRDLE